MTNLSDSETSAALRDYDLNRATYLRFTKAVETLLLRLISCNGLRVHSCTSRLKDRESLEKKISEKTGQYSKLTDITDVSGLRVITYYPTEVDSIAEIVEKEFFVDRANSIDKRATLDPDRFGYLSLHYVIGLSKPRLKLTEYRNFADLRAELQIRSIIQHAWAEIQHDLGYKSKVAIPREAQRRFFRVAAILESADIEFAALRSVIDQYEQDVELKLSEDTVANIGIDTNSLTLFASSSSQIAKLDKRICAAGECKLERKVSRRYIGGLIDELAFAGVATITQLQAALDQYSEALVLLASTWLTIPERKHTKLSRGISIFYLIYILVAARGGEKGVAKYIGRFLSATPKERKQRSAEIVGVLKQATEELKLSARKR